MDHLRGREEARQYLKSIEGVRSVSVISWAELFATAEVRELRLVTLNETHVPMLDELVVPY